MMSGHRHEGSHHGWQRGPEHEHGPGMGRGPGRGGGRRRARAARGDIRAAILSLLDESPMHGYQLMQAIAERTGGTWSPSPGAIYPTISQLEDEGLVSVANDAGRRVVSLTDAGREALEQERQQRPDPFEEMAGEGRVGELRAAIMGLHGAVREVVRSASEPQVEAALKVLRDARRRLYLLLAEDGAVEE